MSINLVISSICQLTSNINYVTIYAITYYRPTYALLGQALTNVINTTINFDHWLLKKVYR